MVKKSPLEINQSVNSAAQFPQMTLNVFILFFQKEHFQFSEMFYIFPICFQFRLLIRCGNWSTMYQSVKHVWSNKSKQFDTYFIFYVRNHVLILQCVDKCRYVNFSWFDRTEKKNEKLHMRMLLHKYGVRMFLLTLAHLQKQFNAIAAEDFWKHCGQRWNCS